MDLRATLQQSLEPYFHKICPKNANYNLNCVPSPPKFSGDYQVNGFLSFPQISRMESAETFLKWLQEANLPWLKATDLQAPGFINLQIESAWLVKYVLENLAPPCLQKPQTILIDYSSPNVAKEMAVHHMRSTFLGDALARIFEYQGHRVIRANHIGDWGAQFGLLLAWIEIKSVDLKHLQLSDLEKMYCQAKELQSREAAFAQLARSKVAQLQKHVPEAIAIWKQCVELTLQQNQMIYDTFNVSLRPEDVKGESEYQILAEATLEDLLNRGLAFVQDGAVLSWIEGEKNKQGEPMALIWRTQDGASLYALTDLACARYRASIADRVLYCTDSRQSLHFSQVWTFARKAGYLNEKVRFEHLPFGMLLGPDGTPYKTREGGTPKLMDFIVEAEAFIDRCLASKFQDLKGQERAQAIRTLAVNAIKYADLVRHRQTNYPFQWEHALALEGNTAPYLLYARVRAQSILRKADCEGVERESEALTLSAPMDRMEHRLWLHLAEWEGCLNQVTDKGLPHLLCQYLYQLADHFSAFYEQQPILKAKEGHRARRLKLVQVLSQRLTQGLQLLGLVPFNSM